MFKESRLNPNTSDEFSEYLIKEQYNKGLQSAKLENYQNAVEYLGESIFLAIQLIVAESYKGNFNDLSSKRVVELCNNSFIYIESNEVELIIKSIDNSKIEVFTKKEYYLLLSVINKMCNWFEDMNRKNLFEIKD